MYGLGQLFGLEGNLSKIARRGSGSACRSMDGGFVEWVCGTNENDSFGEQFVRESHWPELRVFIVVTSKKQKDIGSTGGMKNTMETSSLLQHRVTEIVPHRLIALKNVILQKDFCAFAEICMKESNQLHAVCLDTYPPLFYMNDASHEIVKLVNWYNKECGSIRLAYSFDAGPNAFLFTLDTFAGEIVDLLWSAFGGSHKQDDFIRGLSLDMKQKCPHNYQKMPNLVEYVICTKSGRGPGIVSDPGLMSQKTGLPLV